jgi:23S rRNA (cytidine2498-2'-O)-methyltransferase
MQHVQSTWLVLTCDDGSLDLAEQELLRIAPAAFVAAHLAPGIMLVDAGQPFGTLVAAWAAAPPIFVRHICPVQAVVPLWGGEGDLVDLTDSALPALSSAFDPALPFSVQARILAELPYKPFDVNNALATALAAATGATLDVRHPTQILSVVCAEVPPAAAGRLAAAWQTLPDEAAAFGLIGASTAAENLSNWAGGMRRFAREEGQISRAEFKLLEALEVFAINLPPRGVALDLGAAPGGWSRVLRQHGQYVTAIDPGVLDPRIAADPNVRHKHMTAEAYLRDEPDQFDVIVNDMRMDGRDSARLMVAYARLLYPGGLVLMTLKLPELRRLPVLEHALQILRGAYTIAGARQLFHNRSEITLYLRRP